MPQSYARSKTLRILVTGAAGFIGAHLSKRLMQLGHSVRGLDRLSGYYSPALKMWRYEALCPEAAPLLEHDLALAPAQALEGQHYDAVIHLAAQPGVRIGLAGSQRYVDDNVSAFLNVCQTALMVNAPLVLYASSSSVYGAGARPPFVETESNLHPLSIYGASKLMNEKLAFVLSRTQRLTFVGLRFFSVYGTWGRPDMAYWKIARALYRGEEFELNGDGSVSRDFTHVNDVVTSILGILKRHDYESLPALFNIGGSHTRTMSDVIALMESNFGAKLRVVRRPSVKEDAPMTLADSSLLYEFTGAQPEVRLEQGLKEFVDWYRELADRRGTAWSEKGL